MDIRTPDACIGVVLAGGRSRRMGRDKALLDWNGTTWLEHAIERFHAAGIPRVVVSGSRPGHAGIPDLHADAGPLAGLHAVACAHPDHWLVVVPVDMPMLPAAWLTALVASQGEQVAVHYRGAPLPLAFASSHALVTDLQVRLQDPAARHAIHHWLAAIGATALSPPADQQRALVNLNHSADCEAIRR